MRCSFIAFSEAGEPALIITLRIVLQAVIGSARAVKLVTGSGFDKPPEVPGIALLKSKAIAPFGRGRIT